MLIFKFCSFSLSYLHLSEMPWFWTTFCQRKLAMGISPTFILLQYIQPVFTFEKPSAPDQFTLNQMSYLNYFSGSVKEVSCRGQVRTRYFSNISKLQAGKSTPFQQDACYQASVRRSHCICEDAP